MWDMLLMLRPMIPSLRVETYKWTGNEHLYWRTMARLSRALALLSLLGGTLFVGTAARTVGPSLRSLNAKRLEAAKRWEHSARGRNGAARGGDTSRATDTSPASRVKNITFTNPKASGAYARVYALPRLFVSRASRVLREWRDHTPSQL
jgi:hypothetical protein